MLATVNTFVATAAATLSWALVEKIVRGKASMLGAASGMISGLVAITPAAGIAGPMGAIVMGLMVSPLCYFFVSVVKNKFGYDDTADVFGVHGVGGIVGAILTGVFAFPAFGGIWEQTIRDVMVADYQKRTGNKRVQVVINTAYKEQAVTRSDYRFTGQYGVSIDDGTWQTFRYTARIFLPRNTVSELETNAQNP